MEILNTRAPRSTHNGVYDNDSVCLHVALWLQWLQSLPGKTNLIWSTCLHHAILQNNDR